MGMLEEVLLWLEEHQRQHPDHGHNCACQDDLIRRVRVVLAGLDRPVANRAIYVLTTATRYRL